MNRSELVALYVLSVKMLNQRFLYLRSTVQKKFAEDKNRKQTHKMNSPQGSRKRDTWDTLCLVSMLKSRLYTFDFYKIFEIF